MKSDVGYSGLRFGPHHWEALIERTHHLRSLRPPLWRAPLLHAP